MRRLTGEVMSELTGPGTVRRLVEDVRFAVRVFARAPVLTATIVVTLALGIGATTAVFSIVQAVLLRPLPYQESGPPRRDLGRTRARGGHGQGLRVAP